MDTIEIDKESEVTEKAEAEEADLNSKNDRNKHHYKSIKLLFVIGSLLIAGAAIWGVTRGIQQEILIPASAIASENGSCYTVSLPASRYWLFENASDSADNSTQSKTELFEDDKSLGPAHSAHDTIRRIGAGQFSHWGSALYFSTSDNSNPRGNGRRYTVLITATSPMWVLAVLVPCLLIPLYLYRQSLVPLAVGLGQRIKDDLEAAVESPPPAAIMPMVPGEEALSTSTRNASFAAASRKIRWRWGVLAALVMSLVSLYPQIDLWLTRGAEWQGVYSSMFYDEEVYAAYINGLILGRPRTTQPLQVDSTRPPTESLFSLQVVPPYLLAFLARVTGATASQSFIVLTPLTAFLATLIIFYLFALITGDEILAAVGALAVLLLGTPASRDSVLLKWLLGRRVASGFFLFLRRYQPAVVFPLFFGYIVLVWHAFTAQDRKAWYAAIAAGAVFSVLIFSYFFLWTAALAWLACWVLVWLMARHAEWQMVVKRLIAMALFVVPALIGYAVLLAHRDRTIDKVAGFVFTHAPDFHRAPEWIAVIVILLLIWGARRKCLDWHQPVVLLIGSLALMPFAIFNQQIITGRSLEPHHYEMFSANYLALLALLLTLSLLWRGRTPGFVRRVPRFALALLAGIALCWGVIEANYMISGQRSRNTERDRLVPVAKRLSALAAEHSQGPHHREVVFSPNIIIVSDNLASLAPQAPFWASHVPYAAGLSWEEQQERFFQYLYYCGMRADELERLLTNNDSTAIVPLFGSRRYWHEVSVDFKPITQAEIQDKVRQYAEYVSSFNYERARHTQLAYVVTYTDTPFDFSGIDRWYTHDTGEQIGPFTLYQVKLR